MLFVFHTKCDIILHNPGHVYFDKSCHMRLVPVKLVIDWAVLQNIEASRRYQMNLGIARTVKPWAFGRKEKQVLSPNSHTKKKKQQKRKSSEN